VVPGAGRKIHWICPCCGVDFVATPSHRTDGRLSIGCSTCNRTWAGFLRKKPKTYEESLEYLEPELSKQWHPTENKICGFQVYPKDFTIGSHYKAIWVCSIDLCGFGCEHKWEAEIRTRTIQKSGCPWCCKTPSKICKHQSFAWKFPDLYEKLWDKEKNEISGYEVTSKSDKSYYFKCSRCTFSKLSVVKNISHGHHLCMKCGDNKQKYHDIFVQQVHDIYGDEYEVLGEYINSKTKLNLLCTKHKLKYQQLPYNILKNHIGCPKCQPCGWSRAAQKWIESVESAEGIHIQHKPRDSHEKVIGGYKVDGWCEETQTIYEFHGDYWHGNPKIYQWRMDEVNMSNGKTFGQLYDETCKKTQHLRSLGYRVIEKWETSSTR
jgi:hypothetical protein